MAVVLRKLEKKRHWDGTSWLRQGDVPGDAMKCLSTTENVLSVYRLDEPDQQVDRVVAALAVTRHHLCQLDLVVIPECVLTACGIRAKKVLGKTPDSQVSVWHRDLVELTVGKLAELASAIKSDGEFRRFQPIEVGRAIRGSLDASYIDAKKIPHSIAKSLEQKNIT